MKINKLICLLVFVCGLFTIKSCVMADELPDFPMVIINQIRGSELCCHNGNLDILNNINNDPEIKNLPVSWALRFDALTDENFINAFSQVPKNQTLGVLLEVTPDLASKSGVFYKGDLKGDDWYDPQNAFLVGYSVSDRQKLIDTVFRAFYEKFHFYPSFTAGWMIDSWSLNYLVKTYNVKIHELTKEQYETDNYTLYGGIFNLPFYPSLNNPMIPGVFENQQNLLIMRQTVSDIEKNYGSQKSFYTSQPNDYLNNPGTDISYFKSLLSQTENQEAGSRFALIGMENSLEVWTDFQKEYMDQLKYIAQKQKAGEIQIFSPFDYYSLFTGQNPNNPPRHLKSKNFPQSGILWYFGKNYRIRLEIWDNKVILTDLRIFNLINDSYREQPATTNRAYAIVPYLIDSSGQFISGQNKNLFYSGDAVRTDMDVQRFGLEIMSAPQELLAGNDKIIIKNSSSEIDLRPDYFTVNKFIPKFTLPINLDFEQILSVDTDQFYSFPKHPRFVMSPQYKNQTISLGWENKLLDKIILANALKQDQSWKIVPNMALNESEICSLSSIFAPDNTDYAFDPKFSTFYWHNREAIAGRSSVRLYIDPRNILERPVRIKEFKVDIKSNNPVLYHESSGVNKMTPFFIDFTATQSATGKVTLIADGNIVGADNQIRFYPDCTKKIIFCLRNSQELKGFLRIIADDKINELNSFVKEKAKILQLRLKTNLIQNLQNLNIGKQINQLLKKF